MSAAVAFIAWSAVVMVAAWRRRPAPARIRGLTPRDGAPAADQPARANAGASLTLLVERLGAAVLRRLGRPVRQDIARRLGTAVLAAAFTLPLLPPAAVPAALVTWSLPVFRSRRSNRRRLAAIARDLPDVVDLLVLAVGAGLTVRLAVAAVARRSPGPLGAELARAGHDADFGRRLADALDDVPARAGEATRPLVAALIASERYGAPLGASLERLAHEVRADRRRRAEEAARKVPV
ncbi:MAG TPA: type II secretion system F family protein, partial [Acidimicrobiales bacterium]|nr:type II secretion system F family protein [Acidimicrobiales bacterium]